MATAQKTSLRSTLRWVGPGSTAFAMEGAAFPSGLPVRFEDHRAHAAALGGDEGFLSGRAVETFFAGGGKHCYVLRDPGFADPAWIGEDAGPGARTGLYALAEVDEVGAVYLLASSSPRREEQVLELAAKRPEILFVVEGEAPRGHGIFFLRPNVALLDTRPSPGGEALSAAELASYLERSDWSEEVAFRPEAGETPAGLSRGDSESMRRWRRREGLRRSIDVGTRWVLFEPSRPPLWRSLERETKAFLFRLERAGFFVERSPGMFDARCVPAPAGTDAERGEASGSEDPESHGSLTLSVTTAPVSSGLESRGIVKLPTEEGSIHAVCTVLRQL